MKKSDDSIKKLSRIRINPKVKLIDEAYKSKEYRIDLEFYIP